jgi:hypothetical protein
MTVSLYMDHHVPKAITVGLRLRGVDVVTATPKIFSIAV